MTTAAYQCTFDQQGTVPASSVFQADTLTHAQNFAQSLSTLLNRGVYLVGAVTPPPTLYSPQTANQGVACSELTGSTTPFPAGISF